MKLLNKILNKLTVKWTYILFIFLFFSFLYFNAYKNIDNTQFQNIESYCEKTYSNDSLKTSAFEGTLNLTNWEVNNTRYYHGSNVTIIGEVYHLIDGPLQNVNVSLRVDGILYNKFNDSTDANGIFEINYTVNYSLNIYSIHKIEAIVTDDLEIDYLSGVTEYFIDVNATSYFDIDNHNLNSPQLAGGFYKIPGYLNYDNHTGIPSQIVNSIWKNETDDYLATNPTFTTNSDGSFNYIPIPEDNVSNILYLNLTYNGNIPNINSSQKIYPIQIYRNITCVWNTTGSATEGNTITIKGQLFARNNSNLVINYTQVRLEFVGGATIGNTTTIANGSFSYKYQIPLGTIGNRSIQVRLLNFSNVFSNTTHFINIASAPSIPITPSGSIGGGGDDTPPPFQNFFIIFIPIIIGIAAALIIFAYFHLRKQKEEALIVKLPLEDRIRNLKILKDTGRLEEALSYLFQSIYIELINAKYGRKKNENETIRDFAIISVKELKLNPASIYPFIQNVEKIIYDKPFIIKEQDFYASVELFSPIYFELTGYQFILNF